MLSAFFSSAEMFKKPLRQTVCSGSLLFASILNLSVMLGNYLQQTTFSDAFFLGAFRVNYASFLSQSFSARSHQR